jgi:uncharacterized membrane protein YhaH (DUF805 family)
MTFGESIKVCFSKYATFSGRASKSEFWWFTLFTFIASLSLQIISDRVSLAFTVATILPGFAVTTRRLHDTDRSGWLQLLYLIPIFGWIPLMIWFAQDSKSYSRY